MNKLQITWDQAGIRPARKAATAWAEALAATAGIAENPSRLLTDIILDLAKSQGSAAALLSDIETFTFSALAARINQYRNWARSAGLARGDTVALLMRNRPDHAACWLGLSKEGVRVALINTALKGEGLHHALAAASPRHILTEDQFLPLIQCETPVSLAHTAVSAMSREAPVPASPVAITDTALLIYTSGTTGLPKAAIVSHRRVLNWALWFKGLLGNTEADRMYNCLPMYHSVGAVVATMATLVAGGSTVIAERFSAQRFWSDVDRWHCTQFQYIGELCRYLMAQPEQSEQFSHTLRLACGNGLRQDIWDAFKARFSLPQVIEFYAATEGSFSLYNVEGETGSIGRIPPYLRHRFRVAIVRHDTANGLPTRGHDGLCIPVATGEVGEALGLINGSGQFEGYTTAAESDKKLVRDVVEPGDCWFRTGDLMRQDASGHFYFADRIGDTFRWKGENVSTLEVANTLTSAPGVREAVVYGVGVPHTDGKAGMAFLSTGDAFNLADFLRHALSKLPNYAVPMFLRLGKAANVTATFKHQKQELIAEGYDPAIVGDPLFLLVEGRYQPVTSELHAALIAGGVRL